MVCLGLKSNTPFMKQSTTVKIARAKAASAAKIPLRSGVRLSGAVRAGRGPGRGWDGPPAAAGSVSLRMAALISSVSRSQTRVLSSSSDSSGRI